MLNRKIRFKNVAILSIRVTLGLSLLMAIFSFFSLRCLYWFPDAYILIMENGYEIDFPRYSFLLFELPSYIIFQLSDGARFRELSFYLINAITTFHPYVGLLICYFILKKWNVQKYIVFAILSFALGFQSSSAIALHGSLQSHTFFWITFYLLFVRLKKGDTSVYTFVWTLIAYVLFVFAYLPSAIMGSLLFIAMIMYSYYEGDESQDSILDYRYLALFFLGLCCAVYLLIVLPVFKDTPYIEFARSMGVFLDVSVYQVKLWMLVFFSLLTLLVYIFPRVQKSKIKYLIGVIPLLCIWLFNDFHAFPEQTRIEDHFELRVLVGFIMVFFAILAVFYEHMHKRQRSRGYYFYFLNLIAAIVLIYAALDNYVMTRIFYAEMKDLKRVLDQAPPGCSILEKTFEFGLLDGGIVDYSYFLNEGLVIKKLVFKAEEFPRRKEDYKLCEKMP